MVQAEFKDNKKNSKLLFFLRNSWKNNTTNYDISIFDANKNTMKNYKKVGSDFVEVTE